MFSLDEFKGQEDQLRIDSYRLSTSELERYAEMATSIRIKLRNLAQKHREKEFQVQNSTDYGEDIKIPKSDRKSAIERFIIED